MLDTFASNGMFRVEEEVGASFVLKIDVEGMVYDVLAGMTNVIWSKSKVKSVFMEREHVGSGPDTLRGKHPSPAIMPPQGLKGRIGDSQSQSQWTYNPPPFCRISTVSS